ncbi:hypothetical protein [Marinifilum sp. D714]|uniref:hypothetical protein n=1 Tax=Marinifilum sp. D714 TaxID=2937523 RepID=UPI0027C39A8C|nr:hypothetical protein [Marinifilum sp. D714]MDQ2178410.1 hypothetical protein [Marinifilum sp. D714]
MNKLGLQSIARKNNEDIVAMGTFSKHTIHRTQVYRLDSLLADFLNDMAGCFFIEWIGENNSDLSCPLIQIVVN